MREPTQKPKAGLGYGSKRVPAARAAKAAQYVPEQRELTIVDLADVERPRADAAAYAEPMAMNGNRAAELLREAADELRICASRVDAERGVHSFASYHAHAACSGVRSALHELELLARILKGAG